MTSPVSAVFQITSMTSDDESKKWKNNKKNPHSASKAAQGSAGLRGKKWKNKKKKPPQARLREAARGWRSLAIDPEAGCIAISLIMRQLMASCDATWRHSC